jgi:serine/threonine protein kinase
MVVMDYANKGNFRGNLTKIIKNDWKQKLHMLHRIISGLNEIHKQKLIHCDFHDGNILNHKDEENEENKENESEENKENESGKNKESEENEESENYENVKVYISDLGLCQPIKSFLKKYEIYGVIPFMAPEILRGKHFTPASDIYSFSMIMWEFTSGVPPFNDEAHDFQLSLSICRGERPKIIKNTPQCYVDLMKKCWDEDPLKRPSSKEVLNIIEEWIILPYEKEIEDISKELKSYFAKNIIFGISLIRELL